MFAGGATIVVTLIVVILETVYAQIGRSCTTPNGESARCESIYNCRLLLDVVETRNADQVRFLRESQCGFAGNPLVCCGSKDNYVATTSRNGASKRKNRPTSRNGHGRRNTAIPDRSTCGFQPSDRIFGGKETSMEEFPWMALLEYKNDSNNRKFACGGALISKRYILTAAHCLIGEITEKIGELVNVRLGEWDIRQDVDCAKVVGIEICNKPPENIGIEETLVHPDYNSRSANRYDDIALIRLKKNVKYTDFIRPICLPLPSDSSAVGDELFVAGWGKTESANLNPVKLKLAVPIADRSHCVSNFKWAGINLRSSQICAGGEKGKDSCSGDSGGPLMTTSKNDSSQWYAEGVVSFGAKCGTEGWPGIYTKVSRYLDWIYDNVKE